MFTAIFMYNVKGYVRVKCRRYGNVALCYASTDWGFPFVFDILTTITKTRTIDSMVYSTTIAGKTLVN